MTLSHAVKYSDRVSDDPEKRPDYYLIRYDRENRAVSVETRYGAIYGVKAYDAAELKNFEHGDTVGSVLVEADDIESLKYAYPNYFGDVQLFKMQLKNITQGDEAIEYTLPPQLAIPRKPIKEQIDLSWFKRRLRW